MTIEYSERLRRIPSYPAASAYALPDDVAQLASNESPDPPLPAVAEAIERRRCAGSTATRTRRTPGCARALSDRYGVPAERIAIGNGSCDVLLALGEALLEPGAELVYAWPSFSVYPHLEAASGRDRDPRPAERRATSTTSTRCSREITAATRLVIVCNPNNPTSTAVPRGRDRRLRRAGAAPRLRAPRRGLLRVQHARRPRHDARPAGPPPEPRSCCARSARSTGSPACASGFALCGSSEPVAAVDLVRQPFFCSAPAQAAAIEALRHQDAVAERVERAVVARVEVADGLRRASAIGVADSQANFCWLTLPAAPGEDAGGARARRRRGLRERGVLVRAGTALGRAGCLRVTYGRPEENARFLAAIADALAASRSSV